MHRVRAGIVVVMIVSLIIGLGGCFVGQPAAEDTDARIDELELKAKGLEYLRDRYGVSFQVTGVRYGGWAGNLPMGLYVTTAEFTHHVPMFVHWKRENGMDVFTEDYLYWPMEGLYAAALQEVVDQYFPVSDLYVDLDGWDRDENLTKSVPHYPESFNGETTYDEFHSWGQDRLYVSTVVAIPSDEANDVEQRSTSLEAAISQIHSIGMLSVNVMSMEDYQAWSGFIPTPFEGTLDRPSRWDNTTRITVIIKEWES